MARDYKHVKRSGAGGLSAWSGFAIGLSFGLAIAAAVYLYDHRPSAVGVARSTAPLSNERAKNEETAPTPESSKTDPQYDFYDVLPKFEVVVPNADSNKK